MWLHVVSAKVRGSACLTLDAHEVLPMKAARAPVEGSATLVHRHCFTTAGVAAFIELCSGPLYILAKVQLADGIVAVAEAAATIAKGALTLFLLKTSQIPVAITLSWAQVGNVQSLLHVVLNQHSQICFSSIRQTQLDELSHNI